MKKIAKIVYPALALLLVFSVIILAVHAISTKKAAITPISTEYTTINFYQSLDSRSHNPSGPNWWNEVELDSTTIPLWLSVESDHPYTIGAEDVLYVLRQVALYAETSESAESFMVKTAEGHTFLTYDADTKYITMHPWEWPDYSFQFQVGEQATIPRYNEGDLLDKWADIELALETLEDHYKNQGPQVWTAMNDHMLFAFTDGMEHLLVFDSDTMTLYQDLWYPLSFVAYDQVNNVNPKVLCAAFKKGEWDGQIVRHGKQFARLFNGQVYVYEWHGTGHLGDTYKPTIGDWEPTGYYCPQEKDPPEEAQYV